MRHIFIVILSVLTLFPAISYADYAGDALLNRISMRFNAEQWVETKSALVTIGINAGVSDAALASIQEDVLKKLKELSTEGDWHVVSFNRTQDAAGLEKVQMSAQARLPSTALPKLRDKTKAISKPGETFTLDSVEFTPSEDEIRAAQTNLRNNIYLQAKEELDRISKVYADQKFYIHEVNFMENMQIQPMAMQNTMMMKSGGGASESARGSIAVGNKLYLNATAVIASLPDQTLTKLIR